MRQSLRINQYIFQSTLSVRRATSTQYQGALYRIFQSTLSVRRATYANANDAVRQVISIHALREESDAGRCRSRCFRYYFNPRSP